MNGAYPGSRAVFITAGEEYESEFSSRPGVFGLLPPWAPDQKAARSACNVRAETVDSKPSFEAAWKAPRLCLIPAQAWFEPNCESGHAERRRIVCADGMPLCVAGIWEEARHRDGRVPWPISVLTINADNHPLMRRFHKPGQEKRCAVAVPPAYYQDRLYADVRQARALLRPWVTEEFTVRPAPRPARRTASGLALANQVAA